jgi:hypothetical protein
LTNNPSVSSDLRTYSQIRDDESVPSGELEELLVDETINLMGKVLLQQDQRDAAAVLLRIVRSEVEETCDYNRETQGLWLEYEHQDGAAFESHRQALLDVFHDVTKRKKLPLDWLGLREVLPDVTYGWRQQLAEDLGGRRQTNQARRVREQSPRHAEDDLVFTNPGELRVYRALKRIQEDEYPREKSFTIFPLPRARIPGATREPDFVVTYRGRTGVLEIDGPHHNQRRSHDLSSDHLYRDAGIAWVDRLSVEGTNDPTELDDGLRRFLRRLDESR